MSKPITALALESAADGADLRADIEQAVIAEGEAVVGTRALTAVSTEAADACFGVLALRHGIDWVVERVLLPDLPDHFLMTIAEAMQSRVYEST